MSQKGKKEIDPSKLPCLMVSYNEVKRKDEMRKPSVYCNFRCKGCGWNPEEAHRRMETGKFVKRGKVRTLVFRGLYDELLRPRP